MTTAPMTDRNSQLSSRDLQGAPAEREAAPEVSTLHQGLHWKLVTLRDSLRGPVDRSRAYWVPPRLLTDPPPTMAALSAYAHRGGYTRQDGPARRLGVAWFACVALPTVLVCRYVAWFAERPGRWLAAALVWQALIRSTPGLWLVDHLIHPILAAAAWVFLP